jgi:hypothetical protein
MGQPQVSVVLPVWNGERYLRAAIESVLAQDFPDFELIVIDDGSTDGTAEILRSFTGEPRLIVRTQPNAGIVGARNAGLRAAGAEFIAFLDADDIALPGRLSKQLAFLRAHPEVAAVGTAITHISAEGVVLRTQVFPSGARRTAAALRISCALAQPSVMLRREAALGVGGYRETFRQGAEDYDLWLRLSERHAMDNLPEALTLYRIHGASATQTYASEQAFAALVALCSHRRRAAGLPDPLAGRTTAVGIADLPLLGLSADEESAFLPAIFGRLIKEGASAETFLTWLERAWQLRRHQPRGRLVRHVLAPGALALRRLGRQREAARWLGRAFLTEPLSAAWVLLR